ncbi:hypothetical protein Hdeb2414_s0012g00397701 [Helianthus debilis subsp. tardiflorus]
MDPNVRTTSFNWCRYMITCLNRTTQACARNHEQPFRGQIVQLAAAYAYDTGHVDTSMSKGSRPMEHMDTYMFDDLLTSLDY